MKDLIELVNRHRIFHASDVLIQKIAKINQFFNDQQLDSAVIGISGGIDSALVYTLLVEAAKQPDSPIKMIVALLMPINCVGTTNQDTATSQGLKVVEDHHFTEHYVCQLGGVVEEYLNNSGTEVIHDSPWAIGQLASIVRTPNLYFHAAVLQQRGYKSIVVGTTNRDEGCYIGFFGKASDGMVDLQPIADLHKSEVYQLAKLLHIHPDIINATPTGDVWDGKVDEQMIGVPYWFLQLYINTKDYRFSPFVIDSKLDRDDRETFWRYADIVENLHSKNQHKYAVGTPSHFIDVMRRKVHGGWQ